ncbi:MAG: LacI family DNA-binding transcriptional regulator [Clostridia bacterium]|nr:LacI family DNA-binding transcriptional regulator [Clostridia bacterium]
MNIYDVSEKAGVSIATVSRVLNGNSRVSEKTRNKVLKVMNELGYTPNIFARGLGLNTMKTIGIMCTDSSDMYIANAIFYLQRELRNNGYDSMLCCTGNNLSSKQQSLDLLISKRVDGIIIVGSKFLSSNPESDDNRYITAAAENLPIFLVNGHLSGRNIYSVICNDYYAVYSVTSKMIQSGRRDIVYLYTSTSHSGLNKLMGYKDALCANDLEVRPNYMHLCTKNIIRAKEYLSHLHDSGASFDAVITSDDSLAVGAVKFALANHISIPDELSIAGYNNSILAICTEPEITSVDTKLEELCTTAVDKLMKVFAGNDTVAGQTVIPADIVTRDTTSF